MAVKEIIDYRIKNHLQWKEELYKDFLRCNSYLKELFALETQIEKEEQKEPAESIEETDDPNDAFQQALAREADRAEDISGKFTQALVKQEEKILEGLGRAVEDAEEAFNAQRQKVDEIYAAIARGELEGHSYQWALKQARAHPLSEIARKCWPNGKRLLACVLGDGRGVMANGDMYPLSEHDRNANDWVYANQDESKAHQREDAEEGHDVKATQGHGKEPK